MHFRLQFTSLDHEIVTDAESSRGLPWCLDSPTTRLLSDKIELIVDGALEEEKQSSVTGASFNTANSILGSGIIGRVQ